MSTSIARQSSSLAKAREYITRPRTVVDREAERAYVRFFAAAAVGLILGGIQGIVQRLPGISDWLYSAGYGGHLITNLAQTHVIMVGAGTLTVTSLMYYLLPRILNRPLFSPVLTRWSFWLTVTGVYSFYFVMLIEGTILGGAVSRGIPYDTARHALGAWYDAPTGIAGGIMGVGYWLFVANIYLTMRGPRSWKGPEAHIAKYIFVGTTGLFIGTLQGVYQVLPWSVNFIRDTGQAGLEIDPVAHAHINMVAGMAMSLMGMSFYILPRLLGKPIWNPALARISFWFAVVGVFGFWLGLISLGIIEGNIILDIRSHANNIDVDTAYTMAIQQVGIWHNLVRAGFGALMGVGFWSYIIVIYKTFASKQKSSVAAYPQELVTGDIAVPAPDANSRFHALFFMASITAMLIGTIQGVIQILPFASMWLEQAGQAGDLITPMAHAQMNIVASVGFGLMGLVVFALPKLSGREWLSQPLLRVTLTFMVIGMGMYYIALLSLGFVESIRVHQLLMNPTMNQITAFDIARHEVGWAHSFWLTFPNVFIAIGYFTYATNVIGTLGPKNVREGIENWIIDTAGLLDRAVTVGKRYQVRDITALRTKAIAVFFTELGGGSLGFLGAGWMSSGRPALGAGLLFTWVGSWIIFIEWVLSVQQSVDIGFVLPFFPLYFGVPLLSATCATITYLQRGLKRKARPTTAQVIESSAILIDEALVAGVSME